MKNVLALLLMLIMLKPATSDLTITVTDLKSNSGVIRLAMYDNEKAFPEEGDKAYKTAIAEIKGGKAVIEFKNVDHGTYAIAAFHDANNDGVMNKNAFGIPKEGYGFSNNAMGNFAAPSFSAASFKVDENNTTHQFKLRN